VAASTLTVPLNQLFPIPPSASEFFNSIIWFWHARKALRFAFVVSAKTLEVR